ARRMRALLLAAALLAAGCVAPGGEVDPAALAPSVFVDPIVDDHDHASFEDHALSTPSMSLVGHTPMGEDGKPYSYVGEMDTFGNLTVVQVLGRGSMPGFVVLDVGDPARPTPIGRAEMPWSYVVDVKWSPDGKSVFAASQKGAGPGRLSTSKPIADDPGTALLSQNGFTQWDMSDPTKPVAVAGGLAEPTGCHMLSVKEVAGTLYVFCVANVVTVYAYAGGGAWQQVAAMGPGRDDGIDRVLDESVGCLPATCVLLSAEPHDITVQPDPLDESRLVASVSYWDFGVRFYDVSDPRSPKLLGAWAGDAAQRYEGNAHGTALALLDGKRVAVVGPELLGDTVPALHVLDVSDWAKPALIGEWIPPGAHPSHGLTLTTHQFQVVDGRVYLAYNHAGVWVLDLARIVAGDYADDPARPEVLGYYLPHERVELYDPETAAVPNTWDVNVKDGRIYASDRYTGFYVLQYAGDAPGDRSLTSNT
ncbi:MAG TPA: hypothetical protein VNX21_02180, partial [Candidatus Thermoplasmatota archaeon]|nr:hypothetical protein [Candidatus Thermoplasmatota archaeon]